MRESMGLPKPNGAMKREGPLAGCVAIPDRTGVRQREQQRPVPGAHSSPGRSESAHVGTRKMVNYARAGRGQRKLWWRSEAILTCKSIVRPGYRGERPIEPSSSWFPPKFPSG